MKEFPSPSLLLDSRNTPSAPYGRGFELLCRVFFCKGKVALNTCPHVYKDTITQKHIDQIPPWLSMESIRCLVPTW